MALFASIPNGWASINSLSLDSVLILPSPSSRKPIIQIAESWLWMLVLLSTLIVSRPASNSAFGKFGKSHYVRCLHEVQ